MKSPVLAGVSWTSPDTPVVESAAKGRRGALRAAATRLGAVGLAVAMAMAAPNVAAKGSAAALPAPQARVAADPIADIQAWLALPEAQRKIDAPALTRRLDRASAARATALMTADRLRTLAVEHRDAVAARAITLDGRTLRWDAKVFGTAPAGGRSLWISLHGGGNAPTAVNDQQWRNQLRLYEPAEGIYLAPRAPTDTWNLWHEAHIDPLFQTLIDAQVAIDGVNPDKVYLLGYSAGGDGVWQLAPRMADRFAAAATMAGHPNEATLLPLRNLPFAILMGGADAAYDRNRIARERATELQRLHAADPDGYVSMARIYPGLPHWMNRKDAEALPWMAQFTRKAWPDRVVWVQDDVIQDRFYWLQIPVRAAAKAGDRIDATVQGQDIMLTGAVPPGMILRLSDDLVDLDRPVTVRVDDRVAFRGRLHRTAGEIRTSLLERADAASAASVLLRLR